MVFIFSFSCVEILAIITAIVVLIISRIKWRHQYWKRKGLPYLKPSFPVGNIENPFSRRKHLGLLLQDSYKEFKKMGAKHGGIYSFTNPAFLPVDPDALKNIMQKDFSYFQARGFYYNEKDDPLSAHLFAISGPKWRHLRTKLTPTFTSGKMKMMFDTVVKCADNMYEAIHKHVGVNEGVDIKDTMARYTTDVIGSCAFGLECNSFKSEDSEFRKHGNEVFKPFSGLETFLNVLVFSNPNFSRKLGIRLISKKISAFFIKVIEDTVKYREMNSVKRNDMLQLLIDLRNDGLKENEHDSKPLSILEIAAQAFVFFIAGFETSSTTMTFCLYELALNQDLQHRLRNEINSVIDKYNGKITYEAVVEMKYMSQVIDETLRKYPPLAFVTRTCVEDYCVTETDITIEKGTRVFIPIYALHHDPDYYPDPEQFDPERFSEENRSAIRSFTYIPFGEGPRLCIGMRFGLMQAKIGLIALLKHYTITINSKTVTPLNIDQQSFILTAKEGIWLDIKNVAKN